jgi:hypothetical protein
MRYPLDSTGPDAVLVALGWIVAAVILIGLGKWFLDVAERHVRRAVDAALAPEPEPVDPRTLCDVLACRNLATKTIREHGLCAEHHAQIRGRQDVS